MTNELIPFRFKTHDVRTVIIDGEPWFVAKDVCDVLRIANSRDAMSRIPDKDKGVGQTDTLGGVQKTTVVSESGLLTASNLKRLNMRVYKANEKGFTKSNTPLAENRLC